MKRLKILALTALIAVAALPAMAENPADHMGMAIPQEDPMTKMMHDMHQPSTGDADADFIRSMIPHHQGAVAMAQDVLQKSDDPDIRALAQNIIKAQQDEMAWMRGWLAKKGVPETGEYKVGK